MNRDEAALVRRLALEEAAEALRKLALERGAITVMHMQECLRALAQVPAQSRYCGACEQYVTEPCSSIDCSTPEFCKSQEQQAPAVREELQQNEDNPVTLWAEIHRLRAEARGPDGFATWRDAAIAERIRRVDAERKLASHPAPAQTGEKTK